MDGEMRTIRVGGLPVGGSETRLVDKLQIHFLRKKNGGGEIRSVTVSKATPGLAFITFEESEVAVRLAQRGKQVFKVNDRSYNITISLHHEEVDVDKVLLGMSVLVDHTRLPEGKHTLLCLNEGFPAVRLAFDDETQRCSVHGRYSDVQTLSVLLLDSLRAQDQSSAEYGVVRTERRAIDTTRDDDLINIPSGGTQEEILETLLKPSADVHLKQENEENRKTGLPQPGGYGHPAASAALTDDTWNSGTSFEDFSLIVDSDIFRYLHKHSSAEYHSILRKHDVEVLDVDCDDITTLYLKAKTARTESDLSCVREAHHDLAKLYQHQQSLLRKEHVSKADVPEKDLERAVETLRVKMPRLMLGVQGRNVYMVGSKSEVSEAKQLIGDLQGFETEKAGHAFASSHLKKQGSSAGSPGVPPTTPQDLFMPKKEERSSEKTHDSEDVSGLFTFSSQTTAADPFSVLRGSDVPQARHGPSDPHSMELGGDKCAHSHRTSAPLDFTSRRTDLQDQSDSSETRQKTSKSHRNKHTEPGKERKMAANFLQDLTSCRGAVEKIVPEGGRPPSLPIHSSLDPNTSGGTTGARKPEPGQDKNPTQNPAGSSGDRGARRSSITDTTSGSALRRSNSVSGETRAGEDPSRVSPTREVAVMDLVLPFKLWLYMTSVYNAEIENMTSDLQLREVLGEDGLTLCLKGVDSEKVCECHANLKRLVAEAGTEFDSRNVPLSELGVSDNTDKTLLEFCTLMKQRFKMVKVLPMSREVMILGPRASCDQVEDAMIKTFQRAGTSESPPTSLTHSDLVMKDPPGISERDNTHAPITLPQNIPQTQGITGDTQNTGGTSSSNSAQSVSSSEDLKSDVPSPKASGIPILVSCCLCESVLRVKGTACGFNFCPECEKNVHGTCRTCTAAAAAPASGIKGSISYQESTITLPGFTRDMTLKIVYDIPDGIQGEEHPCPGAPFKGSRFEAFLPFNKSTIPILPLLEKAFHRGLTFTVKDGSPDDAEGRVVWGSIPHKTKTEGGASKNGFPDSTYIKRLDDALKAAGIGE